MTIRLYYTDELIVRISDISSLDKTKYFINLLYNDGYKEEIPTTNIERIESV